MTGETCLIACITIEYCMPCQLEVYDNSLWRVMFKVWIRFPVNNMAEELQRADSNLKPSELKAAFKRSRDIDALLDEERELKEKEVQLLILGKAQHRSMNSTVTRRGLLLGRDIYTDKYFIVYFEYCLTIPCNRSRLLYRKAPCASLQNLQHPGWITIKAPLAIRLSTWFM